MTTKARLMELRLYYLYMFPEEKIKRWLTYGNRFHFSLREFSFVTVFSEFSRYQSFADEKLLANKLRVLTPNRIDIGAIWNNKPDISDKKKLFPLWKELVIDIDLTDYDDVRICCRDKRICRKCWKYMIIACKIIQASLQEDWGFKNILWVFSGRRGLHAWICDEHALELDETQRRAIVRFFQLVKGSSTAQISQVRLNSFNDNVERALKIIDEVFVPFCVVEQDMLGTQERINKFLLRLTNRSAEELGKVFLKYDNSKDRWDAFLDYYQSRKLEGTLTESEKFLVEEIKLVYCYPRIDENVTIGMNHLLKLPFSVHPGTDRISVPIDPEKIESFNPTRVPTFSRAIDEFDFQACKKQNKPNLFDRKPTNSSIAYKTSLKKSYQAFDDFLVGLFFSWHPEKLEDENSDDQEEENMIID